MNASLFSIVGMASWSCECSADAATGERIFRGRPPRRRRNVAVAVLGVDAVRFSLPDYLYSEIFFGDDPQRFAEKQVDQDS
jgi:hypothetical protein